MKIFKYIAITLGTAITCGIGLFIIQPITYGGCFTMSDSFGWPLHFYNSSGFKNFCDNVNTTHFPINIFALLGDIIVIITLVYWLLMLLKYSKKLISRKY